LRRFQSRSSNHGFPQPPELLDLPETQELVEVDSEAQAVMVAMAELEAEEPMVRPPERAKRDLQP